MTGELTLTTVLTFSGRASALRQTLRQARKVAMATGTDQLLHPVAGPRMRKAFRQVQMVELHRQLLAESSGGGDAA